MTQVPEKKLQETIVAYNRPLTHYVALIVGDLERARDIVQEVFIRYWKADYETIQTYERPWLFRVSRNLALDTLKREKRYQHTDNSELIELAAMSYQENQSEGGELLGMMERLPKNQREVMRLKFQYDLSYKEIAEVTGHSVSNVGFLIHTGIKTMKKKLGEETNKAEATGGKKS